MAIGDVFVFLYIVFQEHYVAAWSTTLWWYEAWC